MPNIDIDTIRFRQVAASPQAGKPEETAYPPRWAAWNWLRSFQIPFTYVQLLG
jgi:hypothetical protein